MAKVPEEQWLVHSLDQESKARIKALGNIVVPAQASLGCSILSKLMRDAAAA